MTLLLSVLMVYLTWAFQAKRHEDAAARYFRSFCRKLGRANIPPRRPAEGPVDFGRRATEALPDAPANIEDITDAYVRVRYEPESGASELERLKQVVRSFKPSPAT